MSTPLPNLILASASPRRRELLAEAGYRFTVVVPQADAERGGGVPETPADTVTRLARQKAADVAGRTAEGLILGCDTVVECRGRILGKPADREHARQMLELLRGSEHRVYSGLCLWPVPGNRHAVRVAITTLVMAPLTGEQLDEYLDSGDWAGKAGAFGYQDGHDWLRILAGSPSNVVGLPLELLKEMLEEL
jgi:septum formation protein